ncbi:MAG: hypothetical protein KKF44_00975 [Nanoarchaeota archaeon]|nr:hypothetical protein [Nanoarchaeota archaeon]
MKTVGIVMVLCLFLFFGCTLGGNSGPITSQNLYRGEQGLEIEIFEKSLPEKVYEEQQFDLIMKLTNKGVHPIDPGDSILKVILEKDYMQFSGGSYINSQQFTLDGKENFALIDDFEIKEYKLESKILDEESQLHQVNIFVTACYNYVTKVFADICIDTDIYNIKPIEKVCEAKTISLSGGQGAPVSVTRIEPSMLSDQNSVKPQFKIYVSNRDKGTVIEYGALNTICSSQTPNKEDYNFVELTAIQFSEYTMTDFDCKPNRMGKVFTKLDNEENFIICTLMEGRLPDSVVTYETPLYIELRYGYTISESASITIENIPA